MITKRKLEIYKKYHGDSDGLDRVAIRSERKFIESHDWATIQSLVQDIRLIEKKSVSSNYKNSVLNDIKTRVETAGIKLLYEIAIQTNIGRT